MWVAAVGDVSFNERARGDAVLSHDSYQMNRILPNNAQEAVAAGDLNNLASAGREVITY